MNPNALWPDDEEQDSLFPSQELFPAFRDDEPAAPPTPKPTPGSVAAIKEQTATLPTAFNYASMSLADLFRAEADAKVRIANQKIDLDAALFYITPEDGKWPGSNAETREYNKRAAMNEHPNITATEAEISRLESMLTRIRGEVAAREAELDERERQQKQLDSTIRARDITLRSAELDHARAVFNAAHPGSH